MLVTSREVLHLQAEHEFVLFPLPLPDLKQSVKPDVVVQYAFRCPFCSACPGATFHIPGDRVERSRSCGTLRAPGWIAISD